MQNIQKYPKFLKFQFFFDSVEVRQVISEIQNARDSVLYVANEITGHSQVLGQRESESDPG